MKSWIPLLLVASTTALGGPVNVILDTDMAGDCDDAGALAVLHALADLEECNILAVVTNRKDQTGASGAACDAINHWYGRPNISIGTDKDGGKTRKPPKSSFTEALRDQFPNDAVSDASMPDALEVYLKALGNAPDKSVVICSVGALSNLEDLLRADRSLVERKVRKLVVMGGEFPDSRRNKPETNIVIDIPAAKYTIENWPGEILFTGFEVGIKIHAGSSLKSTPPRNPVRRAYELRPFQKRPSIEKGKPAFDQTAVLLAVRGQEDRFWKITSNGRVEVDAESGHTRWLEDPEGKHSRASIKRGPRLLTETIDRLMAKPPALNPHLPVKIIFDTDLGSDIDDALALAVIHGLQNRGEVELLAVTCSKDHPASATVVDMINTWYGRGDIPIGRVVDGKQPEDGKYLLETIAEGFPHDLTPQTRTMEAVALMRKTLATQPDHSVVLAVVGQQTNLARLLQSKPDQYSPMTGRELVKRKVRMLSAMAGSYISQEEGPVPRKGKPEANVNIDIESAKVVLHEWPTDIIITPYSLGWQLMFPGETVEKELSDDNPLKAAYGHWKQMPYDRPCWDLVSVFYPSRANLDYFNETAQGRVTVNDTGYTQFSETPDGNTILLSATPDQRNRILESFKLLVSNQPSITSSAFDANDLQRAKETFIEQRWGMFICYNIMSYGAQWGEAGYPIDSFNPQKLDCEQWADAAVSAGMKFGLLTTKHHEGFCLWDSAYTEYDIASTPYRKNIVRQYVDAFRSRGLRIGLYYSIWDSTHEIDTGKIDADKLDMIKGQITELLSNYGEIDYFVMDGWFWRMGHKEVPYHEIRELIRELQPNCLITDHTHEHAPYHMDIPYYEGPFGAYPPEGNTMASAIGHCSLKGNGWFWSEATPDGMKLNDGLQVILDKLTSCEARYCNFMLNCMPNRDGRLDDIYIDLLKDLGQRWKPDLSRPRLPNQAPQIVTSIPIHSISTSSGDGSNLDKGTKIGGAGYYQWESAKSFPQTILIDLGKVIHDVDVLTIVPNHRCKPAPETALADGNVTHCRLYASKDGQTYKLVDTWRWKSDNKYRALGWNKQSARFLKLEILDAVGPRAILNEIDVGKSNLP